MAKDESFLRSFSENSAKVRVTIVMPTYNQEPYIREAVDSVLMQKTNFEFLLIIVDDKSTDKSLEIALSYQQKHPDRVKVIAAEKNGGCLSATLKGYEQTKTEYFCVLDPDDYWIVPDKLQNAVDFLDKHPDYTMYVANSYVDNKGVRTSYYNISKPRSYNLGDKDTVWGNTTGVVFRNVVFKMGVPQYLYEKIGTKSEKFYEGDGFRNILHSNAGKAYVIPRVESVYRMTGSGIWTSYSNFQQNIINLKFFLEMFFLFNKVHPTFFMNQTWYFCLDNMRIIKDQHKESDSTKKISTKEYEEFYGLFKQCLEYYKLYLPNTNYAPKDLMFYLPNSNYVPKDLMFYLPNKDLGDDEVLFAKLAAFLSVKIGLKVYFIDNNNDLVRKQLADTKVEFIDYTKDMTINMKDYSLNGTNSFLILPIDKMHALPNFIGPKRPRLVCWCNDDSLKWEDHLPVLKQEILNYFLVRGIKYVSHYSMIAAKTASFLLENKFTSKIFSFILSHVIELSSRYSKTINRVRSNAVKICFKNEAGFKKAASSLSINLQEVYLSIPPDDNPGDNAEKDNKMNIAVGSLLFIIMS